MNTQDIKKIIDMFDASNSVKLKITNDGFEISLEKSDNIISFDGNHSSISNTTKPNSDFVAHSDVKEVYINKPDSNTLPSNTTGHSPKDMIKSPMVGTFYRAPSPDSAPYVNIGDNVKKGQPVAIIEAMKIMNEIEAEFDCKIIDILVSDAKGVEFDTPLFVVERI